MFTFEKLSKNQPTITGNDNSCKINGKSNFSNQCTIRLGVSLAYCGVSTSRTLGAIHCWHGHDKSQGHKVRAEEIANGLNEYKVPGFKKVIKVSSDNFSPELLGKKEIVFFKDYWRRTFNMKKEIHRYRSGDHIDLWNGRTLKTPNPYGFGV